MFDYLELSESEREKEEDMQAQQQMYDELKIGQTTANNLKVDKLITEELKSRDLTNC